MGARQSPQKEAFRFPVLLTTIFPVLLSTRQRGIEMLTFYWPLLYNSNEQFDKHQLGK
jgi:hypothetical protein